MSEINYGINGYTWAELGYVGSQRNNIVSPTGFLESLFNKKPTTVGDVHVVVKGIAKDIEMYEGQDVTAIIKRTESAYGWDDTYEIKYKTLDEANKHLSKYVASHNYNETIGMTFDVTIDREHSKVIVNVRSRSRI